MRWSIRTAGGDPLIPASFLQSLPSSPKTASWGSTAVCHQHMIDLLTYSALKLPAFLGTMSDFHSWKKDVQTEFEALIGGHEYLTNAQFCDANLNISKVLVITHL